MTFLSRVTAPSAKGIKSNLRPRAFTDDGGEVGLTIVTVSSNKRF